MQKMMKLSDTRYIGVDNSEIKVGDIVAEKLLTGGYELFEIHTQNDIDKTTQKVITHSTQPIEQYYAAMDGTIPFVYHKIIELPLSEVKELFGVVDVEKKAEIKYPKSEFWVGSNPSRLYDENAKGRRCFLEGYNQALEDNKEKLFTIQDMFAAIKLARQDFDEGGYTIDVMHPKEIIQSLLPKTEWEVEFVDGKLKLKQ